MMNQNRQDAKDRVRAELDYEVNVRAGEIKAVVDKPHLLTDRVSSIEELLRERPARTKPSKGNAT